MDPVLLSQQMNPGELRALAESAADTAAICRRQITKVQDAMAHTSMTEEQERFWLGETRRARLERLRRHALACDDAARTARRSLTLSS